MHSTDQDKLAETLRSHRLSKLLALGRGKKRHKPTQEDGPAWLHLDQFHCHICHKPISDNESIRLGIGSSDCRPRIEREEQCGNEFWENISEEELWAIWTKYNLYGVKVAGNAYTVQGIYQKRNQNNETISIVTLNGCEQVMVNNKGGYYFCSKEQAREVWKEWGQENVA